MTPKLEMAYRACREVARRAASNFASVEWMLPEDQRRGMQALYAFARRCDDIADSPEPLDYRRMRLDQLRQALRVDQIKLIGQRALLHLPAALEFVSAGTTFAAPEVEARVAALDRA